MKARINYRSKRTIIIISIAVVLLIAAIAGTVAFVKGNRDASAAMTDDNHGTSQNDGTNAGLPNNGNQNDGSDQNNDGTTLPTDGDNTNPADSNNNDNNGSTTNDGTTGTNGANGSTTGTTNGTNTGANAGTTTGTTTAGNNGANVPNQDYTQTTTVITENPWETKEVGWSPISVAAYTAASKLKVHKPDLDLQKYAYLDGDSLEELPVNTAVQKGETITYVIKITNKGNEDTNGIRTIDSIPEGTELTFVSEGGALNNDGKIVWKNDIKAGKTVTVSFKVVVTADSIDLINNIAKVNGEETPETKTPVITANKTAQVVTIVDKEEVLENRDAKVGETIRYTITAKNTTEVDGTTVIKDSIPDGTSFVDGTITEKGNFDKENGTITWNNVVVPAKGEVSVSFDVVVNKTTKIGEEVVAVKSVSNTATVGNTPTEEVETKVANITTVKTSEGKHADGTLVTKENPLHELDKITYTLTAKNDGEGKGTVKISDTIPTGTTLVGSIELDGKSYTEAELNAGIDVTLEAGKEKSIIFTVKINPFETEKITVRNADAKQDGTEVPPTDDEVVKEYVSIDVNKKFVDKDNIDKYRPGEVTVGLYSSKDSKEFITTIKLNESNGWEGSFTGLNKYDLETKALIDYDVREINVDENYNVAYEYSKEENRVTIINTLKYENVKTSKTATKVWNDNENRAGVRPDSIELTLVADETATDKKATANAENNWTVTFAGLNKYTKDGREIEYTITETTEPAHYTKSESGLTVTNTIDYESIKTEKTVTKQWDDNNNKNRPTEVEIGIYDGDKRVNTAKATSPEWKATFTDLQKYTENGEEITYTFKEEKVPDGYVATVKENVIINALPRLEVTKIVKSINGVDATTVDKSTVKENDIIEYLITVKNTGSVTVKNIEVTESLDVYLDAGKPEETTTSVGTIAELTAGKEQSFTVYYKVTAEDVDDVNENLVNVATATGQYTDGNGNEKEVTDDGKTSVIPGERNDLSIVKTQKVNDKDVTDDTKVVPGDKISYTITVKNTGNTVLNNVEVTDSMLTKTYFELTNKDGFKLEDGKLTIKTLALNETKTITAEYIVQESDMNKEEGSIENVATAKADKVPEKDDHVDVPTEAWYANISTRKASKGSASPLHELDTITYTLTATNNGTDDGTVKISDTIPTGTTLVPESIKLDGVDSAYTEEELNAGIEVHLNAGETKKLTFTVTINPFETETGTINIVNDAAKQDSTPIPGTMDEVEKEYTNVIVNKKWVEDNTTQANRRPSQIRFELYADNSTQPLTHYDMNTTKSEDSYTFEKLSKYNSDGTPIKYTVQEKEINTNDLKFYESKHSESTDNDGNKTYNFTNTFRKPTDKKEITVTKIWDDRNDAAQKRPGEITLELNGKPINLTKNADAEQNDGNKWSTKVTVDVYDENGEEIDYEVTESDDQVPLWYTKSIVDKTTIKNTFKAPIDEKYDITLTKVWKDSKNKANKRPTSIKFDLYKINVEGEKVVVEENIELKGEPKADQWTITRNVQKYDEKANVIKYFVVEKETGSIFYINTDTDTTDLTVTNKFEVPNDKADISVKKVWNDNNNSAKRESVTIRVTGNGKYEDIVLTSENANATDGNVWEKNNVDTKLPKYDSLGNEIDYTFDEVNIPDGYIKTVKDNEITNSLPGIVVTKTVKSVTNKDGNKMDTTGVNQITVNQGDVIEYLITVKNTGTVDLTNVTVTDNLNVYTDQNRPDETTNTLLSNGALAKGANLEYTVYYKVTENDVKVNGQTLKNTATAQGSYKDSNDKTNTIKDEDSAYVTIADAPGVEIVKTQTVKRNGKQLDANAKVEPGDVIEYTITVTNTGNTILQNVVVEDSMIGYTGFELTSGNWNIGALDRAPNNVAIITAKYTVQESDMKELESTVKNVATVKTTSTEPKSSEVEVPTEVWKSEISVKKESRLIKPNVNTIEGKAEYGDKIEYTITATNTGRKQGTIDVADKIDTTKTELIDFSKDITNLTEEEYNKLATTEGLTKTLTVEGNGTTSIIFTVRVIAKSGENITNTAGVGKDNTPTSDKGYNVEKKVKVTTKTEIPKITNSNVAIVLDISGSMLEKDVKVPNGGTDRWGKPTYDTKTRIEVAKKAVKDFIDTINLPDSGNTGSAVSVVTFRGPSDWTTVTGTNYTNVLSVDEHKNTIATNKTQADYLKAKVDAVKVPSAGGTVISGALQKATEQVNKLKKENETNKNIVIFVGDGKPQCDGGDISDEAEKLKATGATVYTIGFKNDVEELKNIASDNGKGGKLYYTTSDNVDLSSIFTTIGTTINPGKEEQKESAEGLIELPNIDTSKNITINGKTDTFDSWCESGIINYDEDKKVYFLDTSKFDADESIEIEYFEKN